MKRSIKNAGYLVIGSALMLSVYSCNSSSNSSTTATDSTASVTTAPQDSAAMASNAAANTNKNQEFVTDVLKANAQEMQMLQAGIDKGTSKTLKEDAKKMLADHKDLAKQLTDYANKNNIALPAMDNNMDMGDMNSKTGKDWDAAWADKMVDGHQKTIAKFETSENEVTDPALKTMITNTLPTLHKHLDMVQKLQTSLKS